MASFISLMQLARELYSSGRAEASNAICFAALSHPSADAELSRADKINSAYKMIQDDNFSGASSLLEDISTENEIADNDDLAKSMEDVLMSGGEDISMDNQQPEQIEAAIFENIINAIEKSNDPNRIQALRAAADKLLGALK